jgi:predicted AAA+ superfamily ATPase
MYMTDTGLAAALLGIQTPQQMATHPLRGAFFETMVVNEFLKSRANAGLRETLYFWRDNVGTEVDLILERSTQIAAVEMKSGITVASDAFGNLKKWHQYASERAGYTAIHLGLVYGGDTRYVREGVDVMPWDKLY